MGLALPVLAVMRTALGADFSVQNAVELAADHDSNRRLVSGGGSSAARLMRLASNLRAASATADVALAAQCNLRRYQNLPALDSNDCGIAADGEVLRERTTYTAHAAIARDSELVSDTISGSLVDAGARRRNADFSAGLQHALQPRLQLALTATRSDVSYLGQTARTLVDYRNSSLVGAATYALSERNAVTLQLSDSELDAPQFRYLSRGRGAAVALRSALSPLWTADASLGLNSTRVGSSEDSTQLYSLNLTRQSPRSTWLLGHVRQVAPDGSGRLDVRSETNAEIRWKFSEKLQISAAGHLIDSSDLINASFRARRRYTAVETAVDFQLTEPLGLQLRLLDASQHYSLDAADVSGRSIRLSLRYSPREHHLTR